MTIILQKHCNCATGFVFVIRCKRKKDFCLVRPLQWLASGDRYKLFLKHLLVLLKKSFLYLHSMKDTDTLSKTFYFKNPMKIDSGRIKEIFGYSLFSFLFVLPSKTLTLSNFVCWAQFSY